MPRERSTSSRALLRNRGGRVTRSCCNDCSIKNFVCVPGSVFYAISEGYIRGNGFQLPWRDWVHMICAGYWRAGAWVFNGRQTSSECGFGCQLRIHIPDTPIMIPANRVIWELGYSSMDHDVQGLDALALGTIMLPEYPAPNLHNQFSLSKHNI